MHCISLARGSRWISLLIAVLMLLAMATPVFAIADPDLAFQINAVWVYRNCLEDLDQLYVVDYTIDYTGNPDENITEAFLCRLMDGEDELRSVAPYTYYDDGYDRGVISIYFSAIDAPTWEGDYSIQLVGNPTLSWPGDPPETTVTTFDLWQDWPINTTQVVLSSRILWLADQLELAWSVDLVETTAAGSKLTTTYGEDYFVNAVPNLREMASHAFSGQITQPEVERREFTQDYANTLAGSVTGTPLDLSPVAAEFGISTMMFSSLLFFVIVAILIALSVKLLGSYKPAILISIPCVAIGALLGVIPLVIAILSGFVALVMTGYVLFYQKSGA